jgi:hypothetical protein
VADNAATLILKEHSRNCEVLMNPRWRLRFAGLVILALGALPACTCGSLLVPFLPTDPLCRLAPYSNPPETFEDSDLVGTWQVRYDKSTSDRLIIESDGTFKQIYEERIAYVLILHRYETSWNRWWVERFPDGRVRLHLEGARYYFRGRSIAELEGMGFGTDPLPWPYRDPFSRDYIEMVKKLVLNVRAYHTGELFLHHMSFSSDEGFAMVGCQAKHFRRVRTP